jgi:hypothetical protein
MAADSYAITDPVKYAASLRYTASQLIEIAENLERGYVIDIFQRQVPYTIEQAKIDMKWMGVEGK